MHNTKSVTRVVHADHSLNDLGTQLANTQVETVQSLKTFHQSPKVTLRMRAGRAALRVVGALIVPIALFASHPQPTLAHEVSGQVGFINTDRVNLRSGPSTGHRVVDRLNAGQQVTMLHHGNDWTQVQTSEGVVGWIWDGLLETEAAGEAAQPAPAENELSLNFANIAPSVGTDRGAEAALLARRYAGSRYRWGAEGPNSFDCSGLTLYVYRQLGVYLPHSARAQYSSAYGQFVSRDSLQPGDLIFFANTAGRGLTHVAIYLGEGRIVHAVSPRHGVIVSSLYDAYWSNHYYGALRPN